MKIVNYKDIPPITMDNDMVKNVAGRVMLGKKDGADNFCMRLFEMEKDGYTPMHTHDWEHEIFVHSGKGEVFIEDTWHALERGTAVFVPPGVEHQFRNKDEGTLCFICLVPPNAPEI